MSVFSRVFDTYVLESMILAHCGHNDQWKLARIRRSFLKRILDVYGRYDELDELDKSRDPTGLRFVRTMCARRCEVCRASQREFDAIGKSLALRPRKPCVRFSRESTASVDIPRVLQTFLFAGGVYELDLSGEGVYVDSTVLGSILGMLNIALPGQHRPHNWRCGAVCRMRDSPLHVVCRCTLNPPDYDVEPLAPLRSVKKVSICDTSVGNEGVEMLRHVFQDIAGHPSELRKLDASWCPNLTDGAIAEILHMGLTHLDLGGTGITNAGIRQLRYARFKLQMLGVSRLDLDDVTLHMIVPYPDELRMLDISRTQITDHGIVIGTRRFVNLRHLEAFACPKIGPDSVAALEEFARTHENFQEATVSQFDDEDADDLDVYDLDRLLAINRDEIDR